MLRRQSRSTRNVARLWALALLVALLVGLAPGLLPAPGPTDGAVRSVAAMKKKSCKFDKTPTLWTLK